MPTDAATAPSSDLLDPGPRDVGEDMPPSTPRPSPHLLDATMFWNPSGGVHRTISAKCQVLAQHGWRHTVLAPGAHGAGQIDCGGLPLPASGGYRLVLNRRRVARLIEEARPDIVEAADPYTMAWAVLDATRRLGVPAVAFCHSNLPAKAARWAAGTEGTATPRGRWAARRAGRYLADLYGRFDLVLAPSRSMTQQLHDWGVRQALHQPLGVDCSIFQPRAFDPVWRSRLSQRLGLPVGTRLLVYCGRFAAEKNLGVLADAVRLLGPGHALVALGDGPRPPGGEQVRLLPPEHDSQRLARLLASCDAFVHAGDQETFGLAALEAMACGTPVVVSAAAGLGELAQGAGLTVASLRPREWADAIAASLAGQSSQLAAAALDRARTHDRSRVLAQQARRYRQLMRQQPRAQTLAVPTEGPMWGLKS